MRRIHLLFLLVIPLLLGPACKKNNAEPPEANLAVSLNPDPGNSVVPALSDSYGFKLIISSIPPKNGVSINISVTKDLDNSSVSSQVTETSSSSITSVDLQVNSLQLGVLYQVKLDITSKTTPTNKASLSFKVARK